MSNDVKIDINRIEITTSVDEDYAVMGAQDYYDLINEVKSMKCEMCCGFRKIGDKQINHMEWTSKECPSCKGTGRKHNI